VLVLNDPPARLRHDFRLNANHLLVPVLTMFASHGTQALRLVAAGGLIFAYSCMHEVVQLKSRELLMKFGERVLEVARPREPRGPPGLRFGY